MKYCLLGIALALALSCQKQPSQTLITRLPNFPAPTAPNPAPTTSTTPTSTNAVTPPGSGCTQNTLYKDVDQDGLGDPSIGLTVCSGGIQTGYVANSSDCDDTDPVIQQNCCAVYVSPNGLDSNDGTSWAKAMKTLWAAYQTATTRAPSSTCSSFYQVFVQRGLYKTPAGDAGLLANASRKSKILGGFVGTETAATTRPAIAIGDTTEGNWTIIDGKTAANTHVLRVESQLVVDRVWIRNGQATASSQIPDDSGGGILVWTTAANLTLSNSIVSNNTALAANGGGGGLANFGTVNISQVNFFSNQANYTGNEQGFLSTGGAIQNFGTATVNRSVFYNNQAIAGGGITNAATLTVTNSIFSNNQGVYAGAIANLVNATLINNTFLSNLETNSQGTTILQIADPSYTGLTTSLTNNILWGDTNPAIGFFDDSNFATTGGPAPTLSANLINQDPKFVSGSDLHLQSSSPAIGTGDPSVISQVGSVDFDGNPRLSSGKIHMGAYQ